MNKTTLLSLTFFFLLFPFFTINAQDSTQYAHITQPVGPPPSIKKFEGKLELLKVYLIPANPDKGFHWDYYLATPKQVKPNTPLFVQPNNDGLVGVPIESHHYWSSIRAEQTLVDFCIELGTFALVPVFPRPKTNDLSKNLYVHALSRASMTETDKKLERPDLQMLAMIDDAQDKIRQSGFSVPDKFMLWGFSAAGDFVTRMAFLHPQRVQCVVAGGLGGLPILPLKKLDNTQLTYPVGAWDFKDISKSKFNKKALKNIPILLFQGGNDENDSVPEGEEMKSKEKFASDSYSYEQSLFVNDYFGEKPVDRVEKVKNIYQNFGFKNFKYVIIPDIEHSAKPFKKNALEFFKKYSK